MKLRKILIKIGAGLLIFIGIILVVRAVLNFTEGRALARTLAELKAKGVPLTAKDLAPPCPDEDNAARLWKAIENTMTIPGRPASKPTPDERARRRQDFGNRELMSQAWTDLLNGKPWTPEQRSALRDLLEKNQRAFEMMAELVEKPCFLYRDPGQPLIESLLPDAIKLLNLTRLLLFSALFDAEEGRMGPAIAKIHMGLKFAPFTAQEGPLMPFLISVAEDRILSYHLGEICRGREIGGETLASLIEDLDPRPWAGRLAAAIRGERVVFLEAGRYILNARFRDLGSIFEGPRWWQALGLWLIRPLIKRDMRKSLPNYGVFEAQTEDPFYRSRGAIRSFDSGFKERPWYAVLSKNVFVNLETPFTKVAVLEAILTTSRAGLACRLYKSRTGRYPESLNALVPEILPDVPIDPFTGKPLVYRPAGNGFIVYSLGSNEKDDGGRSTFNYSQLVMDKDDDWSWREDR